MKVVVGSTALAKHKPYRTPLDLDIWTDEPCKKEQGMDIKTIPTHILALLTPTNGVASLNDLYTIKCSHLGWNSPNWTKHKLDILYMKSVGAQLKPKLYKSLVEFWKTELGNKPYLSLDKSKEDFFTDNVTYQVDHDWLHEQVAYPNKPVYTLCLKEGKDVLIDHDKFIKLPKEQQLLMFREEITVIAIERWLLNPKSDLSWVQAYHRSLHKTVTTLTKGWATEFIIMNMEYFNKPKYKHFKHALEATKDK